MAQTRLLLPAACAAGLLALASPGAHAEPLLARYEVRFAGLHVMDVEAVLDLEGHRYRVTTRTRTTGLAGVFSRSDQVTLVEGAWRGAEPLPARYRAEGTWRGDRREVAMDWVAPGQPVLRRLEPPREPEREPVPEALQRGTMDTLSAMAKLTRTVALTGRCEGGAAVYDGRRRADITAWTDGVQRLPQNAHFGGEALRCGFESRLLAGARLDRDPEEAKKPQPATAWIGRPLPDRPPIPVRIEVPTRWFGHVRVVLAGVAPLSSGQEIAQGRN
ncbi:DUF3108 domain-containing protein [Roseicella aerolata]|uniref:DUF3108 domain-containing protein n=1 Tax=Roseicella aerolata TaxID=2883479 RepID=A0A9X1L8F6_9PROT|nr:DUF3108 domain-containing protein [Roseicella aerolata]MCB4823031.1 DUF3108 domain-containing protein [Roseicella aerolata]